MQAADWLKKAADQGNPESLRSLGVLYGMGKGVPKDFVRAYSLVSVAVALGNSEATAIRDYIAKKLSPHQLATAEVQASRLHEKYRSRP